MSLVLPPKFVLVVLLSHLDSERRRGKVQVTLLCTSRSCVVEYRITLPLSHESFPRVSFPPTHRTMAASLPGLLARELAKTLLFSFFFFFFFSLSVESVVFAIFASQAAPVLPSLDVAAKSRPGASSIVLAGREKTIQRKEKCPTAVDVILALSRDDFWGADRGHDYMSSKKWVVEILETSTKPPIERHGSFPS